LADVYRLRLALSEYRPGIILYQAGADTHIDDPLGGLLTSEQMRERDRAMFSIAHDLSIPLTWNLAGGYQIEPDGSIPRVVELHLNTFEEALRAWRLI
jgi:acetoin utilization deacetylase AcuC-like enzyme